MSNEFANWIKRSESQSQTLCTEVRTALSRQSTQERRSLSEVIYKIFSALSWDFQSLKLRRFKCVSPIIIIFSISTIISKITIALKKKKEAGRCTFFCLSKHGNVGCFSLQDFHYFILSYFKSFHTGR